MVVLLARLIAVAAELWLVVTGQHAIGPQEAIGLLAQLDPALGGGIVEARARALAHGLRIAGDHDAGLDARGGEHPHDHAVDVLAQADER